MVSARGLEHALRGALGAGGGVALLQTLLARKLTRPSSLSLSLATFVGLFRLLEELERESHEEHEEASAPVAGAVAGVAALLVLEPERRGVVVSVACCEAAIALGRRLPVVKDIKHKEFLVGVVLYTQLVYMWIYRGDLFTSTQLHALDKFTLSDTTVAVAMRDKFPSGALASRCDVWHPHEPSCAAFHARDFLLGLPRLARLYFPIFLVTAGLLKWHRWLRGPRPSLLATLRQFAWTTVAFKLNGQIGVMASCLLPTKNHRLAVVLSGALTTLYLLAENDKRRASAARTAAVYVLCTSGTWTARALAMAEPTRQAWQLAFAAAAFATLLAAPATQSRQLMELLHGQPLRLRSNKD